MNTLIDLMLVDLGAIGEMNIKKYPRIKFIRGYFSEF